LGGLGGVPPARRGRGHHGGEGEVGFRRFGWVVGEGDCSAWAVVGGKEGSQRRRLGVRACARLALELVLAPVLALVLAHGAAPARALPERWTSLRGATSRALLRGRCCADAAARALLRGRCRAGGRESASRKKS
jgi:hypothetical protein